jgi:hypothetical protein
MGMLDRSNYIVTKRDNDKFYALDKKNRITTWSIITGKVEKQYVIEGLDLSEYALFEYEAPDITYKREWY